MRNFPLQFVDEKVVQHINAVRNRQNENPAPSSQWIARLGHLLLSNLDGDGPRSIANFERIMKGR